MMRFFLHLKLGAKQKMNVEKGFVGKAGRLLQLKSIGLNHIYATPELLTLNLIVFVAF